MKKLLVILLLFFPVHGAWGDVKHLRCIWKNEPSGLGDLFEINEKAGTVRIIEDGFYNKTNIVTKITSKVGSEIRSEMMFSSALETMPQSNFSEDKEYMLNNMREGKILLQEYNKNPQAMIDKVEPKNKEKFINTIGVLQEFYKAKIHFTIDMKYLLATSDMIGGDKLIEMFKSSFTDVAKCKHSK